MISNNQEVSKNKKEIISYSFAKHHGVLISEIRKDCIKIIYRPDCSPYTLIELRRRLNMPLHFEEMNAEKFTSLLTSKYETKSVAALAVAENISETFDLQQMAQKIPTVSDLLEESNDAPVIMLINALLREAIKKSASDIHFETFVNKLVVRFRIDGVLHNVLEVSQVLSPLITSRLKIMAKLNISEKRLPQDGRITVDIAGRAIDIRVSTVPTYHGERIVLRLLNKNTVRLNLTDLGMSDELLTVIRRLIAKPHGIILVTGPTGSGKTTTLYAMLTELNVPGRNIMTIEDPIEYDLPGIGQIQVNRKIDMTFAKGLRAILRQDPNIVMVGEIRDLETAIIATQASLTGHLVFSTLHTNTAIGAITRLRDLGVESFLLSSSLIGVIAQRLIRLLCKDCKLPYEATTEECILLGISPDAKTTLYRPKGCVNCNKTGYSHRVGIYEIIEINAQLRTMIHENKSEAELEKVARTKSLGIKQNSFQQVLSGNTFIEEVLRINE